MTVRNVQKPKKLWNLQIRDYLVGVKSVCRYEIPMIGSVPFSRYFCSDQNQAGVSFIARLTYQMSQELSSHATCVSFIGSVSCPCRLLWKSCRI